jgi:hypothetical protein
MSLPQTEGGAVSGLLAALGGQAAAAATGGKLTRAPACDPRLVERSHAAAAAAGPSAANGRGPPRGDADSIHRVRREPLPRDLGGVSKDCFIIPQANLERFLPDGITVKPPF